MRAIDTPQELDRLAARLAGEKIVAADIEAAGYHRYDDRACLLQLTAGEETVLVDTLAVTDLNPLRPVFTGSGTEVIFHDADYDLRLLDRDFGMHVRGLFDTKVAAEFLGAPGLGLASLLESYLGVQVEKKFQRADWAQRPLPRELLEYAVEDTRYLPSLRDRLRDELAARGRLHWAEEEFRIAEGTRFGAEADPELDYLKMKGARDLGPRELAALRELWSWREAEGLRRDAATFRVLSKEALLAIAAALPTTAAQLERVKGLSRRVVATHGTPLLASVRKAIQLPEDELPSLPPLPPRRPRPEPSFEARVDRLKEARDAAARRLGLDRGFLMARWQLAELADAEPRSLDELRAVESVRAWQVEALGADLIAAL